jgi:hypothetical protein
MEEFRILHKEHTHTHTARTTRGIILIMKSRRLRWAGRAVNMREARSANRILVINFFEWRVGHGAMTKIILRDDGVRMGGGRNWFRICPMAVFGLSSAELSDSATS